MKSAPGVWGIDLGQCGLKALRLQEIDGQLTATAFDYVEYPKILSQPDAEPDQLTREALEQFLSRNTLRGDIVSIAVPGQSGLARFVKLPPVEEKKIAEIVKFEAKQQIPFNLDEVVWDYQKLGNSQVIDGFALDTEVGLFAMKRDMIKKYLDHFKDVGVEVHVIQMAPLALCNYIAFDLLNKDADTPAEEGKPSCVVGLDLGTDSSNLVVTDGGKIIWQRPIPLGGNHFTRALTKDMKLTFAKAEHLKRNAAKSGAADLKKILSSLKPVLNDFVGEVQRSLGYFTNTHRDAQIEYMVGLGNAFRLPGLQRFLAEKLQLEVRKVDKMARLTGDTVTSSPIYQENLLSFGVAYGLCLQGIKRAKLITNLLPPEIRMERLVRAKKPWAVAAAAMLLLGLGGAVLGGYLDARPYKAEEVKKAIKDAGTVKGRVDTEDRNFNSVKDQAVKEEEAVKSIIAGQGERVNWMKLLSFIGEAVPQPDGKNLPDAVKKEYFLDKPKRAGAMVMSGQEAYIEYQRRQKEGLNPMNAETKEVDSLPRGIDDLVQFNIESIDCRFCEDLPAFWQQATKEKNEGHVRPKEHFKQKLPDGKGWVVEVAGYTYHHARGNFVRETLLANIARLGWTLKPDAAPMGMPMGAPMGMPMDGMATAEDTKEPIVNRVSHVLLYQDRSKKLSESSGFDLINSGVLDSLIGGSPAAGGGAVGGAIGSPGAMIGGMPMGMPPGAAIGGPTGGTATGGGDAAAARASWRPLSSRTSGAGTSQVGGMVGGMIGGPGGGGIRGGAVVPMPMPMPNPMGNPPTTKADHDRTEFVILFIWKEPTPSDSLRGGLGGAGGTPGIPGTPGR